MSFPASWARVPITATYLLRDEAGTPATGRVEFRSAQIVVADGSIIVPVRVTATLDSAGQISLLLPATDDPDIQPNSWTWSVTEIIDRQPRRTYSLSVPHDSPGIDLSSIAPIPPGTPVYDYLLTSAIGVTVAGQGALDAVEQRVDALEQGGSGVQLSDDTPEALGAVSPGTADEASRADHVHPVPSAGDVGADPAGTATGAVTAHESAPDPHQQYLLEVSAAAVATSGSYGDLTGRPTLGTAAAQNVEAFATAAQGAKADTALQSETDPTVPSWAKQSTKPSYSAAEISGLGDSATRDVGSTAGTVTAGDDARLSDARTPTAHSHPPTDISDSTATGRAVLTAADAAAARTAIGAEESGSASEYGVFVQHDTAIPLGGYYAARSAVRAVAITRLYVVVDAAITLKVTIGGSDVYSSALASGTHSLSLTTTIAVGDAVVFTLMAGTPTELWAQIDGGAP